MHIKVETESSTESQAQMHGKLKGPTLTHIMYVLQTTYMLEQVFDMASFNSRTC